MNGLTCRAVESTKPSPTNKAGDRWTWIVLGIVIGLVVLNVIILVVGAISKRLLDSKGEKKCIAENNTQEMTAVKLSSVGTSNVAVEIET